jgi:hypothetical protein
VRFKLAFKTMYNVCAYNEMYGCVASASCEALLTRLRWRSYHAGCAQGRLTEQMQGYDYFLFEYWEGVATCLGDTSGWLYVRCGPFSAAHIGQSTHYLNEAATGSGTSYWVVSMVDRPCISA